MRTDQLMTDSAVQAAWTQHYADCLRCRNYREGKSATLVHICPEGAPLIKRVLEIAAKPALKMARKAAAQIARQHAPRTDNGQIAHTSKTKLAKVMRYAGDNENEE